MQKLPISQKKMIAQILIAAVLFAAAEIFVSFVSIPWYGQLALFAVIYLIPGWNVLKKSAIHIAHGQIFDENFLMAVATIAAFAIGEYPEAVEVILFYQIGTLFEKITVERSRQTVSDLLDLCPDEATVQRNGKEMVIPCDEIEIGERIIVKPGEKIPLDGIVVKGNSTLDTAALTGESIPVAIETGSEVCNGCMNLNGVVELIVTKIASESTAAKIMELVEESTSAKTKTERFITRFAKYYTPCVVIAAIILAILPPFVQGFLLSEGYHFTQWIYRALTFLIISCPCALVISVPLSFFGGIGCASKNGILVKGSNYLEVLAKAQTVVMDKTGTLTEGKFYVTETKPIDISATVLLEQAALAESASNHPIAKSLLEAYKKKPDSTRICDIHEVAGKGVSAIVDGKKVLAGNADFLHEAEISTHSEHGNGTFVHVAIDKNYVGYLRISDRIKEDAPDAMRMLRQSDVDCLAMLTGDNESVAKEVSDFLALDEVHAKCMPGDKVRIMQEYRQKLSKNRTLVFVGDGMNDAPVLAQSDVGVAMGGLGSDAAIAAADLVILDDKPSKIGLAMRIAKKTVAIAKENIIFAFVIKAAILLLGALGFAKIGLAIFADVGVAVIAILNAMRTMWITNKKE